MASEKELKGYVSNPFLDPIGFWQNYLINWIEASRGFYKNAIKVMSIGSLHSRYLVQAAGLERKETAKEE